MKKYVFLFTLLTMVVPLFAQNYPNFPIGQTWQFPDARSLALGGAGTVSLAAPGAMIYNPASLTQIDKTMSLDISLSSRKLEERRSYPLYDRFDSILLNSTYVINNNWYPEFQGGLTFNIPAGKMSPLVVAVGTYLEIDHEYTYLEEVRENIFGDRLIAYNRIRAEGTLRRYAAAISSAFPPLPGLSLGIQAGLLQGNINYQEEVNYVQENQRVEFTKQSRELDNTPVVFSFGTVYRASERISAGFDIVLPYSVEFKSVTNGDELRETIEYPLKINGGFEFRARQKLQARLNIDIGYEFWSSVSYKSQIGGNIPTSQKFDDVFYFKTGIEHIFFNKIPFRVGAQYRTSYLARGTTQTLLGAGTGFFKKAWQVDISGAFSRVNYRWEDLFDDALFVDDPNFQSRIDMDSVNEITLFILLSVKYAIDFR
jgi:hypothetical protein